MSSTGLTEKVLAPTFILAGSKKFVESGQNTLVADTKLRMRAKVDKAGGVSMTSMQLQIFGMSLSIMNQLSTLGMLVSAVQRNSVVLQAGDVNGMTTVFNGTITAAWTDPAMPDVSMMIEAQAGLAEAVLPSQPVTYADGLDVAEGMSALATSMGLTFENNGVNVKLPASYFSGSARDQARAIADAAGINWLIDNGTLAIWPRNGYRPGDAVMISKDTGMVGYPEYTAQGIKVDSLFNPGVKFGGKIQVKSELFDPKNNPQGLPASGIWSVYKLGYDLASNDPGGPWFSRIEASNPQFPPQIAQ